MNRLIRDTIKVFLIFMMCTVLFYVGLQIMHREYEEIHRYDPPEGPAVKVSYSQTKLLERFQLFFQQGE
ncbi:YqzK family protein [Oceanobacillus sp. FSL K6-2867]|uniref:YqzK family protein n=1 Tax=Oceanobacillus sp. FSL K6-2867 TaxID=2954748 RepID=UPI0030D75B1C